MSGQNSNQRCGWVKTGLLFGLTGILLMLLSGCVSSGKFEGMTKERDVALEEKAQLEADIGNLVFERDNLLTEQERLSALVMETEQQKQAAAMKAKAAQDEINRQQQVYNNLQSTFAKEQQSNQVKI